MNLKADVKNWQTTVAGFLTGLIMCLSQVVNALDSDPETVFVLAIFISGLGVMGLGLFSKDGDKTGIK